jgi:hypothetical protein
VHSRVTSVEIDTVRISVEEALRRYREEVVPGLREQPGYRGMLALVTPEGKGLVISFWKTEEEATNPEAEAFRSEAIARFVTSFRAPPGRDHYEVALAELPALEIDRG